MYSGEDEHPVPQIAAQQQPYRDGSEHEPVFLVGLQAMHQHDREQQQQQQLVTVRRHAGERHNQGKQSAAGNPHPAQVLPHRERKREQVDNIKIMPCVHYITVKEAPIPGHGIKDPDTQRQQQGTAGGNGPYGACTQQDNAHDNQGNRQVLHADGHQQHKQG